MTKSFDLKFQYKSFMIQILPIQILHNPNLDWSKFCRIQILPIQILQDPNRAESKSLMVQILFELQILNDLTSSSIISK